LTPSRLSLSIWGGIVPRPLLGRDRDDFRHDPAPDRVRARGGSVASGTPASGRRREGPVASGPAGVEAVAPQPLGAFGGLEPLLEVLVVDEAVAVERPVPAPRPAPLEQERDERVTVGERAG